MYITMNFINSTLIQIVVRHGSSDKIRREAMRLVSCDDPRLAKRNYPTLWIRLLL